MLQLLLVFQKRLLIFSIKVFYFLLDLLQPASPSGCSHYRQDFLQNHVFCEHPYVTSVGRLCGSSPFLATPLAPCVTRPQPLGPFPRGDCACAQTVPTHTLSPPPRRLCLASPRLCLASPHCPDPPVWSGLFRDAHQASGMPGCLGQASTQFTQETFQSSLPPAPGGPCRDRGNIRGMRLPLSVPGGMPHHL